MAKTSLQGVVNGARRTGKQKKRLEDNLRQWTGMELGDSLRAAEDRIRSRYCYIVICGAPTKLRDGDEMRDCDRLFETVNAVMSRNDFITFGCNCN